MDQQDGSCRRPGGHAPPGARGNVYQAAAVCALLLLAVALVFGQTVRFEFINLDDRANVVLNPHLSHGLTPEAVKWAFTDRYVGCWMPLTWISHLLDCQFYGLDAGGHHLTNVLLHAATAVLLFLVLRQMTGRIWPSAWVAAVFAIHPLRVESVAWVTERKDVLSGLFFVLTLGAYVSYVRHRFSLVRYAAVVVPFALGLLAKPMLVTLPFVLLLLDYWPLGRWTAATESLSQDFRSLQDFGSLRGSGTVSKHRSSGGVALGPVLEKVPLLALSVFSCVMTLWAAGEKAGFLGQRLPLSWRAGNALISYVNYLGMFFYPANLATPYPRAEFDLPPWEVFGAVLVLVVVTSAALAARRKCPYLPVGWLWYVGMLVPASGILQFAVVTMCDRFTYLPQIGLCIALAWTFADGLRSSPRGRLACGTVAVLLVAILMGLAWHRASFWRDSVTLWNHALAHTSRNSLAHQLLGEVFLREGRMDEGMDQYRAAIAIEPDNAASHYALGVALAGLGRLDEAIEHYQKTVQVEPDNKAAHNNLGGALYLQRRFDLAMSHFREAIRIDPQFAEPYFNAGNIWHYRGHLDEAIAQYQQALKADPDFASAHYALGLALARRGRLDEAITHYGKALEAKCDSPAEIHNRLGLALAARGRPDEAVVHFRRALAIQPDFASARRNLERVLAGAN